MTKKSLKNLNSLKFDYSCKSFIEITCYEDLFQLSKKIRESKTKYWILGEGTNVVILNDLEGLVIKNKLLGVTYNNNSVESASGENWDDLVKDCLQKKLYGFENLSGIPGSVGGSPIQNIGAYGVEVSNFIDYVETVNLDTGNLEIFNFEECKFGYRESIFKKFPNLFITKIKFSLSKAFKPNLTYESIPEDIEIDSADEVRKIILKIRNERLINPKEEPNVGSFFKNPVISKTLLDKLLLKFSDLKFYYVNENQYKVSAAWLIEKIGMKGYEAKDCGVSKKHSLVLVNFSQKSENIIHLSNKIRNEISKKFDITLEYEPTLIT